MSRLLSIVILLFSSVHVYAQTYHVRSGKDVQGNIVSQYGDGSGDSYENAWAGFEAHRQDNKVPAGSTVIIHGEIVPSNNRSYDTPQFWNDRVTLKGADDNARLKFPYVLKDFWGHDDITVCDLKIDKVGFRGWEWQNVYHSYQQFDPSQRSKNITFRNVTANMPASVGMAWELNQGNDNWIFLNCDLSGTKTGIVYTKRAQGTQEQGAPKNLRIIGCKLYGTNPNDEQYDGHAIGIQPADGLEVAYCEIYDCGGAAIELYQSSRDQKNCWIHHNKIYNIRKVFTLGRGIAFTGKNDVQVLGKRTGNRVEHNEIFDTDGAGIALHLIDPVYCANNKVTEPRGYDGSPRACIKAWQQNSTVNVQVPFGNELIGTAGFIPTLIQYDSPAKTFDAANYNTLTLIE